VAVISKPTQAVSSIAFKTNVVTGATVGGTNAITGMATTDEVFAIIRISEDTIGMIEDITTNCTVVAGGFTATNNLSGQLALVLWHDTSA